jgi:hypothetical protein
MIMVKFRTLSFKMLLAEGNGREGGLAELLVVGAKTVV